MGDQSRSPDPDGTSPPAVFGVPAEVTGEPDAQARLRSLAEREPVGTFGPFDVLGRIAIGGMAEILLARRTEGDDPRPLVVKKILAQYADDRDFVSMFRDEARLGLMLQHRNVVRVLEEGEDEHRSWMAMEWVDGEPLRKVIRVAQDRGGVPPRLAAAMLHGVADGLSAAHTLTDEDGTPLGLIHRDVSPHNVMVGFDGVPKLLDFGIAKAEIQTHATRGGVVKGKFSYMAPEQCQGQAIDHRVDIFALGIVLFESLVGESLYRRDSEAQAMNAIVHEPVPRLRDRVPSAPAALDAICQMALSKRPRDRYPTAAAFRDALAGYLRRSGGPVTDAELASFMRRLFPKEVTKGPALDTLALGSDADARPTVAPRSARAQEDDESDPAFGGAAGSLAGIDLAEVDVAKHAREEVERARASAPDDDPMALDLESGPASGMSIAPPRGSDLPTTRPPRRVAAPDTPTFRPRGRVRSAKLEAARAKVIWGMAGGVLLAVLAAVGTWLASAPEAATTDPEVDLTASIFVTSVPPGAAVQVDGEARGTTPLDATRLGPGAHRVELRMEGYEPFREEVVIGAEGFAELQAHLEEARATEIDGEGRLTFGCSEPAKVYARGVLLGETPITDRAVPPGTLELELELEGGERLRTAVFVRGGGAETRAYVDVDELR
ncbi:MAG: serine/threonine-protein kinase [Myxococcota bacterium]